MNKFEIYDKCHAENFGEYESLAQAIAELKRLAELPWNVSPNLCPCTSWQTCGRLYEIVELNKSVWSGNIINRSDYLEISSEGVKWLHNVDDQ